MKNRSVFWLALITSMLICNFSQFIYPSYSLSSGDGGLSKVDASAEEITKLSQSIDKADGRHKAELLVKRGEMYRLLGYYPDAHADFKAAIEEIKKIKPHKPDFLDVLATQSLGYIHFLMQDAKTAESLLREALQQSERLMSSSQQSSSPYPALSAVCANHLGNVVAGQNRKDEALNFYTKALGYIEKSDLALAATIHRNIASVVDDKHLAFTHLNKAEELAAQVTSLHEKARLLLEIASEYSAKEPGPEADSLRYPLLNQALEIARTLKDQRLISTASGELGGLYESRGRISEAITLTEQAVESALMVQAHDLLVQWEWQWGRLLKRQAEERNEVGQRKAIAAYKRALFHVEAIRQDMPVIDNRGCSSFRQTLSPIYTGLADMLLKESGVVQDRQEQQQLLRQAQQAVESIKQSELQDYFKDPCIDAMKHEIQSLSGSTAVIYPVILPDRLELLADIGGTLYRKTSDVRKDDLEQTVTQLAANLRNSLFHEELGKKVYGWVIEPLQSTLDGQNVDTLVVVPDGVFRMIPLAALWTGEKFLGQKYAVVIEPALTLLDPSPLPEGERNTLLAGVSKPGPVVLDLPINLWNQLTKIEASGTNRKIRGISIKQDAPAVEKASASETVKPENSNQTEESVKQTEKSDIATKENKEAVEKVRELLELPGVDKEIAELSKNLHGQKLMNREFLRDRFSGEIKDQNYRIVHVASHGFFGGSPEENFIMTYDKLLNMNLLEEYIKPKQFVDLPVELLTLSACQTAEGDDRSPLGLSGVALKSGARSVLGSLWPVSDTATQLLLSSFYRHLSSSDISKAKALQKAQIELINTKDFNHPFYWSAFILVGNWL
ncbi:MAG: CHAT domain-containing protein [Desulfamplus sp.]|nr:CHAT domain-containing protein [Desulfamplus sp.]